MKTSTVGQLMIDQALPKDMQGQARVLDKKGLRDLMREVAEKHPEEYSEVAHNLSRIGMHVAFTTGGNSFGLRHLRRSKSTIAARVKLKAAINAVLDDDKIDDDQRDQLIIKLTGRLASTQQKQIYDESLAEGNPLAYQVLSGSRGNPMNLASLLGSDLLYTDHRDRTLPVPILRSYSQGLTPLEYWAGAYGARKGVMDTKFATQDAGFLSKQLNQIVHRALVTKLDYDKEPETLRGLPVDVNDDESEGALLARDVAGYKRNTIITPKILQSLRSRKIKRILVRSPAVGGPGDGGIYARDAGVREFGRLPQLGANVGMTAAQAMSEPLSQAQLSSKHAGGVAGASANRAVGGFDFINQLIQTPKLFKGGAAHAELDGLVQRVEDAPAGGKHVWIENQRHYVGKDYKINVKRGDHVEAGDVISEGAPNPSIIVMHKGVGEGRRYFINAFRQAFRDAGIKGHRRNIELLAKGLINHVRLTEEMGEYVPDDIVSYQQLERSYKPRPGAEKLSPNSAIGRYLERPYLHYTIGTKVRPSMLQDFQDFGISEVETHSEDPPFQPEMVRGMANLQHDPDWVTRMFGSGLKTGLLRGVHRGATSDPTGTSFVPALARGVDFGRIGKVRAPKPWSKLSAAAGELREKMAAKTPEEREARRKQRIHGIGRLIEQSDIYGDPRVSEKHKEDWKEYDETLRTAQADHEAAVEKHRKSLLGRAQSVAEFADYRGGNQVMYPTHTDSEGRQYDGVIFNNKKWRGKIPARPRVSITPEDGGDSDQYLLPRVNSDPGYWFDYNPREHKIADKYNQQWYVDHYNKAVREGGSVSPEMANHLVKLYEQEYPELHQQANAKYWNPDRVWKRSTWKQRIATLKDAYQEARKANPEMGVPTQDFNFNLTADRAEPPPHYKYMYPDFYKDFKPTGQMFYDPKFDEEQRTRYQEDPEFTKKLKSLDPEAQRMHGLHRNRIRSRYESGAIDQNTAGKQIKKLNSVVMAVGPENTAYHIGRWQGYPDKDSPARSAQYNWIETPEMLASVDAALKSGKPYSEVLRLQMDADPAIVDRRHGEHAMPKEDRFKFIGLRYRLEMSNKAGTLSDADYKKEMTRLAGVFMNSPPGTFADNYDTPDVAAGGTQLADIPDYAPISAKQRDANALTRRNDVLRDIAEGKIVGEEREKLLGEFFGKKPPPEKELIAPQPANIAEAPAAPPAPVQPEGFVFKDPVAYPGKEPPRESSGYYDRLAIARNEWEKNQRLAQPQLRRSPDTGPAPVPAPQIAQRQPPPSPIAQVPPQQGRTPPGVATPAQPPPRSVQPSPLAQAPPGAVAPRPGFERRDTPFGLSAAKMAPQAVSSMVRNTGPAGIGAYGLLFNPGAVATLAVGPGGNKPGRSATPKPAIAPGKMTGGMKQPAKSPSNPLTAPGMKSKTMVPG